MPTLENILWQLIAAHPDADLPGVDDWSSLVQVAESHGVAPLLHKTAASHGLPISSPAARELEKSYYLSAGRAQVLRLELDRLDGAFKQAGLSYLPLKGAALAWTVYPDPALRPMYDLDLLVQPADLLKALGAAQKLGYRLDKLTYHAVLRGGPGFSISLELHWCLPGGTPLSADIFSNISNNVRSKLFEIFSYLYCAVHLLRQHAVNPRLIWRYDLRLLAGRIDDRPGLLRLAEQLGVSAELQALDPQTEGQGFSTPANIFADTKNSMRLLPRIARLRLAGALLFPSKEYMLWRYRPEPEWLWPAWYGKRMGEWGKHEMYKKNKQ